MFITVKQYLVIINRKLDLTTLFCRMQARAHVSLTLRLSSVFLMLRPRELMNTPTQFLSISLTHTNPCKIGKINQVSFSLQKSTSRFITHPHLEVISINRLLSAIYYHFHRFICTRLWNWIIFRNSTLFQNCLLLSFNATYPPNGRCGL